MLDAALERRRLALAPSAGRLYAVLDAARDPRVLALVTGAGACQSLYEGHEGRMLAAVAPYLVDLGAGGAVLDAIVGEGWGRSWGIFIHSAASFRHLRRQLRRLLMVTGPAGQRLYFRFYDPRVLRCFMPGCTPRQGAELFAEADCLLAEGPGGRTLHRYGLDGGAVRAEIAHLS